MLICYYHFDFLLFVIDCDMCRSVSQFFYLWFDDLDFFLIYKNF